MVRKVTKKPDQNLEGKPALDSSDDNDDATPRSGYFAFPSDDGKRTEISKKQKNKRLQERPVVYPEWKSETPNNEALRGEAREKKKRLKASKPDRTLNFDVVRSILELLVGRIKSFLTSTLAYVLKNLWSISWFIVASLIFGIFIYLKVQEEYFSIFEDSAFGGENPIDSADHYAILEINRSATQADVKKAYRTLSLRWHPDRNIGCYHCSEKFTQISRAYELLSDEDRRNVYDTASGSHDAIESKTVSITQYNYARMILDTQLPWIIQVYTDFDSGCRYFSRHWEAAATSLGSHVKFGRINAVKEAKLLKSLPIRIRIYPTVYMYFPKKPIVLYQQMFSSSPRDFLTWVQDIFPYNVPLMTTMEEVDEFATQSHATTLAHGTVIVAGAQSRPPLEVKSLALRWLHVFSTGYVNKKKNMHLLDVNSKNVVYYAMTTAQNNDDVRVIAVLREGTRPIDTDEVQKFEFAESLEHAFFLMQQDFAPYLVKQNAGVLCRSNPYYRSYCLVVTNSIPGRHNKLNTSEGIEPSTNVVTDEEILLTVKESKKKYNQVEAEFRAEESEKENEENFSQSYEPIHIQLVRLLTVPLSKDFKTYLDVPRPPPRALYTFLRKEGVIDDAKVFLIDLDGHQISKPMKIETEVLASLYFDLYDGQIRFTSVDDHKAGATPKHSTKRCKKFDSFENDCLADVSKSLIDVYVMDGIRTLTIIEWLFMSICGIYVYYIVQYKRRAKAMATLTQEPSKGIANVNQKKFGKSKGQAANEPHLICTTYTSWLASRYAIPVVLGILTIPTIIKLGMFVWML